MVELLLVGDVSTIVATLAPDRDYPKTPNAQLSSHFQQLLFQGEVAEGKVAQGEQMFVRVSRANKLIAARNSLRRENE